jgi:hypothetical protein
MITKSVHQDLLEIQIYGIDSLKRETRVNWSGVISLPLIGMVKVAGLTGEEAEALIAAKYEKDYLRDPQVLLFIKEFTSQRITSRARSITLVSSDEGSDFAAPGDRHRGRAGAAFGNE